MRIWLDQKKPKPLGNAVPTVVDINGLRVAVYPHDHGPVHVIGRGGEVVVNLRCPAGPPELREAYGFGEKDFRRILTAVAGMVGPLCAEWERYHGHP